MGWKKCLSESFQTGICLCVVCCFQLEQLSSRFGFALGFDLEQSLTSRYLHKSSS